MDLATIEHFTQNITSISGQERSESGSILNSRFCFPCLGPILSNRSVVVDQEFPYRFMNRGHIKLPSIRYTLSHLFIKHITS
jgi:hypothetical protein